MQPDQPQRVDPRAEYERRLRERRESAARHERTDNRLSLSRGLVFLAGVGLVIAAASSPAVSPWWILLAVAVFIALVIGHARVVGRLERARRAVGHYETALDRLDDRWIGVGPTGGRYLDPDHVYAADLDLFGRGSLFQLISRARTRLGEDTLAAWLLGPADAETVRRRQQAIDELRPRLDLRESLALLEAEVHEELDQNRLRLWAGEQAQPLGIGPRIAAVILAAAFFAALVMWLAGGPLAGLALVVLVQSMFTFRYRRQIHRLAETADEAGSGLAILSQVLQLIERERFETPLLHDVRTRLDVEGSPPSHQIARLHGLIQGLNNSRQNQFFAPIAFVLGMPIHLVDAIEKWRQRVGPHIPDWLRAAGEFEALLSLAGYAYERPRDPFPEIAAGGPCFDGEQIGHPLLPKARCVHNDLRLGDELRVMLVSGSNMSGKSTLLRTVGTNAVLALAGAPVRARRLKITPVQVGTAMRVSDSLQEGTSLFYAVVRRVKRIVELASGRLPLLFLLDEILQGTNSHDRRIGAEGVITKLVESGAIGLVTTHDLALTEIVESLGPRAVNVHFEDQIVDGRMTFDYRLRSGVVEKSNALELMRMMGLEV